ncbi:MAG: PepSY-associated TM helix domain-containing protein [Ferruginibacter sp.]
MSFKKIVGKLHLWLGLSSGIIVCFLGITGCLLAFELEIRSITEPYRYVKASDQPFLPPTVLKDSAEKLLEGKKLNSIEYLGTTDAALGFYYDEENYKQVLLNPYTGHVQKVKNMNRDFFRILVDGHFYLWLPANIGQPIVASATLIFLVMMITGLILWWPKNKSAAKQRFRFQWKPSTKWRRKNYDLHNVLGFYMTWIAIFLAITGLVFGFQWFAKSVYWVTSAGKSMPEHQHPHSDTTQKNAGMKVADIVWHDLMQQKKENEKVGIAFPAEGDDALEGYINHRPGTYYNTDYFHYDQYTGKELPATGTYAGKYRDAIVADKIARMNYDIHVGAVLGLPGKILAFFASLIAASLPVTGFYIWWGRRKKNKATAAKTGNVSV